MCERGFCRDDIVAVYDTRSRRWRRATVLHVRLPKVLACFEATAALVLTVSAFVRPVYVLRPETLAATTACSSRSALHPLRYARGALLGGGT